MQPSSCRFPLSFSRVCFCPIFAGGILRLLPETEESGGLSCTSKPRVWGIPSRKIAPVAPVEDILFHKVPDSSEKSFCPQPRSKLATGVEFDDR